MTVEFVPVVTCDAPDCTDRFLAVGADGSPAARRDAAARGWTRTASGQDRCPSHPDGGDGTGGVLVPARPYPTGGAGTATADVTAVYADAPDLSDLRLVARVGEGGVITLTDTAGRWVGNVYRDDLTGLWYWRDDTSGGLVATAPGVPASVATRHAATTHLTRGGLVG